MWTNGQINSLTPFQAKRALLWWFNVAGNNAKYLGLYVKCLILIKFFIDVL